MKTRNTITICTTILPLFIAGVLAGFGLLPKADAVVPAPDGGYPGFNTAEGQNALFSLTTGQGNTAVGWLSLRALTQGSFNTAIGAGTLLANTGDQNTATGAGALLSNATGSFNTANGAFALFSNTVGNSDTAIGFQALFSSTGSANTAVGREALFSNTTGTFNTAIGRNTLFNNTTGSNNLALGAGAGGNVTTAGGVICIGASGANVVGGCFIGNIFGVTTVNTATPVLIDSAGQLGTMSSSRRFKREIKEMDNASKAIHALKPVTFQYKSDNTGTPQFGLIAEEVAKVNPDLVVHDKDGKPYSVRYDQVNAMLLNEFLKEHRTVQEQKAIVEQLKQDFQSRLAQQQKQIEALTAGLQKVSAQVEMGRPAPRVVVKNQ